MARKTLKEFQEILQRATNKLPQTLPQDEESAKVVNGIIARLYEVVEDHYNGAETVLKKARDENRADDDVTPGDVLIQMATSAFYVAMVAVVENEGVDTEDAVRAVENVMLNCIKNHFRNKSNRPNPFINPSTPPKPDQVH